MMLVHVAHVVRPREPECAVLVERHVVERNRRTQMPRERGGVFRTREHFAGDPIALSNGGRTALEDAVCASPDVFRCNPGQLPPAEWQREYQVSVGTPPRSLTEIDEVFPLERCQQIARR